MPAMSLVVSVASLGMPAMRLVVSVASLGMPAINLVVPENCLGASVALLIILNSCATKLARLSQAWVADLILEKSAKKAKVVEYWLWSSTT
jgi:hypothetical protein